MYFQSIWGKELVKKGWNYTNFNEKFNDYHSLHPEELNKQLTRATYCKWKLKHADNVMS